MDSNDDCDISPSKAYASSLYGPFRNLSRVGDEYQAEIPPLLTKSEFLDYMKTPFLEETKSETPIDFLIGLDIPIVWIKQENMKDNKDNAVVPGCVMESWSEVEKGSFVLGLYIFRKDFVRLSRFMETKKIGDILAYYYGSFYSSNEYKRWSNRRERRGKRCIMGQRIFSGLRQQEFLARLVPHVSQECLNDLLEVSRTFGDAKISLEQYVTSIKTLIGIKKMIDAVAIGKGKQDLTRNTIEPTKQNQAIRIWPEIPIGQACSSLTPPEIIQFLTGDYRLSKARSNDLFWEAVWPILLARGWHSEQPNGYNYAANGKTPLVFLMPGVKKFSRKLVKGDDYLDCVTDVLNKVASDPQLLEFDNGQNGQNETILEDEEEEEDGFVEKRKSHYLQPRAPSLNLGNVVVKLTVVDTSFHGRKVYRVKELETKNLGLSLTSRADESHSELVSSDVSDCENVFLEDQETNFNCQKPAKKQKISDESKNLGKKHVNDVSDCENTFLADQETSSGRRKHAKKQKTSAESKNLGKKHVNDVSDCENMFLANQETIFNRQEPTKKQKTDENKNLEKQDLKTVKLSRKLSLENAGNHAKRRRRLTACIRVDSNAGSSLDSHVGSSSQANINNHKLSSNLSFTSRCSSIDTVDEQNRPQKMNLIDLNVTLEFGNSEFVTEVKDERNERVSLKRSENLVGPTEQEDGGSRRHSTRTKPPTAKALEAIASGFLTVNSRKGNKDKQESKSRNYQNTPEAAVVSESSTGDASSAIKGDDENGEIGK
ncbi:uncharacterized protein LOC143563994 [Bidens hawaiensis]|uniref:uncharacterized protein LOC143563994 n=1 Tax=Bidens hawaiensis TaxID=980011 RepID=UPI00404B5E34